MTSPQHLNHSHHHDLDEGEVEPGIRRGRWVFWIFGIIAAVYLISEHRAHVPGALPFLIILACPLMHMFMHGGHGGHGAHGGGDDAHVKNPPPDNSRDWKE